MQQSNKFLTLRNLPFIIVALWCAAPFIWLILRISGFSFLDGLFGLYYNQPWQESLVRVAVYLLPISIIAAIVTLGIAKKRNLINIKQMVIIMLLSVVMPFLLSEAASSFPIRFVHPNNAMCDRGNVSTGYNCSYQLKIGF